MHLNWYNYNCINNENKTYVDENAFEEKKNYILFNLKLNKIKIKYYLIVLNNFTVKLIWYLIILNKFIHLIFVFDAQWII